MNVIDWLLDSDPAIRWQVMRDLTDAPDADVAAERAKVATEGWGAQILALSRPTACGPAHHDELPVDLGEAEDQPSRWITLRALRVLRWAEGAGRSAAASHASA
jgi:hypothetical protein